MPRRDNLYRSYETYKHTKLFFNGYLCLTNELSSLHLSDICLTGPISHLIHAAHAIGFHRGDGLAKKNEVEAGKGLDWRMVGDVTVYLAAGIVAQGIVVAGHETAFIDKGDMPEGHVADDVMLYGCGHSRRTVAYP